MDAPLIELRPYQQRARRELNDALQRVQRVMLVLPTGAGKTVLAASIMKSVAERGPVYFVCHRQELLDQTSSTLTRLGVKHSFIANNYPHDPYLNAQVCSMATLARRPGRYPTPLLAIVDEAHHGVAKSWREVIESWNGARIIGLSATPERLDGRGLGSIFQEMVAGPTVFWLIEHGFLSKYKMLAPDIGVDTSKLKTVAGDYAKNELADLMDNQRLIGPIVQSYLDNAKGSKALLFAVNVTHSQHCADAFNDAGVRAAHLDAKTPKHERRAVLYEYALGKYDVICNVGLFGEGFDLEANANHDRRANQPYLQVTIETIISARPTQSLSIWLQQCGRALRPKPDPAMILDHAGNVWRHGLPDDEREWSLHSRKRKIGEAPIKQCPSCYAIVPAATQTCAYCGYAWPQPAPPPVDDGAGELVELDIEGMRQRKIEEIRVHRAEQASCTGYTDLVQLAVRRGYKRPNLWARHVLDARIASNRQTVKKRAQRKRQRARRATHPRPVVEYR